MTLANTESSFKQSNNWLQWFEKAEFPPGRGRGKKCHRAMQAISVWKSTLKHKYGISFEIYQMMYNDQGSLCYFCGTQRPSMGSGRLAVHHDEDSSFVRGLPCRPCNANFIDEYRNCRSIAGTFHGLMTTCVVVRLTTT